MRRADDIPASLISLRIAVAEKLGASRVDILNDINLTEQDIAIPTNRISVEKALLLWDSIKDRTGSQDFGLIAGSLIKIQALGLLGYVWMNSASITDALFKFGVYQRLVASVAFQRMIIDRDRTIVTRDMQVPWQLGFRYTLDFMIAGVYSAVKSSSPFEIEPIEIGFQFPTPSNHSSYQEFFPNQKILFGCENSYLIYLSKDLDTGLSSSDSTLTNYFEKLLTEALEEHDRVDSYSRSVKRIIRENINADVPSLSDTARELGLGLRSLQTKLKEEGTSFQKLMNEVRKEISIEQLKKNKLNISEIAFYTGFNDLAVFSRNFKKWTGLSPSQYQSKYL